MKAYFPVLYSGKYLPQKCAHTAVPGGQNASPVISWGDVPEGTKSFALLLSDTHPSMAGWIYWCVINIPATVRGISERASILQEIMPKGSLQLRNSYGDLGYAGPKILPGSEPHMIELTIHALSEPSLSLGPYAKPEERESALEGKIIATAKATALFSPEA